MLFNKYIFQLLFFFACCHFKSISQSASTEDVDSTIIHLADPTIFSDKGLYYLYGTVEGNASNGFLVYTSSNLKTWKLSTQNNGYALKKSEAFGTSGFWAPQVFFHHHKYYMAYTANENIAIAESNSPLGPFKQKNREPLAAAVKQIDPFIFFDDDGKAYLYHVRLTNGNKIFVAELTDDLLSIKQETLRECITATQAWENTPNTKWSVTEGPSILKHKNLYYLFYSANDFRNPDYAIGYATSNNPLGPWKKYSENPIIDRKLMGYNGTGHGDFFKRGKKIFYVLHTHYSNSKVSPRNTALVKVKFVKNTNGQDYLMADKKTFHFLNKVR
jgi:xylan 1,4-beta-xylosidase